MDSQIVKDLILISIERKIEKLKARGIIVANYDEILQQLLTMGYPEDEVKAAIVELVRKKEVKAGKFSDGRGWLRDYRLVDKYDI